MSESWWIKTNGSTLAQGDLLPNCLMPVFTGIFRQAIGQPIEEVINSARLIVVTQSCDLENEKIDFVALCPIHTLAEFEDANPEFSNQRRWEEVRKGRIEGLHLLSSPNDPDDNRSAYVVDFGHIVSIPLSYLSEHAESLGDRWRLNSPFLEHFSQAFARFFMRVGLPSLIPPFK